MNPKKHISAEAILNHVSQEALFEKYLGVPVRIGERFCSPLRQDVKPTCTFKWDRNKLLFRDWAWDKSYNIFQFVSELYGITFKQALYKIEEDFILDLPNEQFYIAEKSKDSQKTQKQYIEVDYNTLFTSTDISYLKSFGLNNKKVLNKFCVFHPIVVKLNGSFLYRYNEIDPALAYYFGDSPTGKRWKLYFYKRKKGLRFIGNTNRIAGWVQLPETADTLIITKSLKDVMLLYRFGYPAIAGQSETFQFYDSIIDELKQRFKHIYVLYDNDHAGHLYAQQLLEKFQIPFIVPPEKDITDTFKLKGKLYVKDFLNEHTRTDSSSNNNHS